MRWIGLDIGDKTIGVAVSDPLFISAQGVTTIERVGIKKDTTKVMEYIKEYEADTVVCGLPLMLDGSDSPQTEKVREFVERLKNKTQSNGLKLNYVLQENVLIEANMRREKRKTIIDRQAAVIILQSYMDAQRRN